MLSTAAVDLGDTERLVAKMRYDADMNRIAQAFNMKIEDLEAKLSQGDRERQHKERLFAGEAAMTLRRPPNAPSGGGTL